MQNISEQKAKKRGKAENAKMKRLLNTILESREGPEMFPRIFAASIVWMIVFGFIVGYMWLDTPWLTPLKVGLNFVDHPQNEFCYLETKLTETEKDTCC